MKFSKTNSRKFFENRCTIAPESPEGIRVGGCCVFTLQGLAKTLSDSLGLVKFPVRRADFICHLPDLG